MVVDKVKRKLKKKIHTALLPNFEKNQWLSHEKLMKLQSDLLRKMIKQAFTYVQYWKNYMKSNQIHPEDIKTVNDLTKLPITDKEMMRGRQEFISEKIQQMDPKLQHTGGSTGRIFKYYTTYNSRYSIHACRVRGWRWGGFNDGDRIATFTGGGLGHGDLRLDCVGMNEKIMDRYIKKINDSNIQFYRGIPSGLLTFAKHVENRKVDMRRKAVFTTSENLYPDHRKFINKILGEVFDAYGANDGGSSAYECPEHNGWHISIDNCILEIIKDGERIAPGEEGIITVTNLTNYGMPWIRYMSNDLGILSDEKCSCGRSLPLMSKLLGRTTDLIQTKNCIINGTELANNIICKHLPINAFQFIQKSKGRLNIRIVQNKNWSEKHENVIAKTLHNYDPDLELRFEYPDDIPKTPAGKSKYVISEL